MLGFSKVTSCSIHTARADVQYPDGPCPWTDGKIVLAILMNQSGANQKLSSTDNWKIFEVCLKLLAKEMCSDFADCFMDVNVWATPNWSLVATCQKGRIMLW